MAKILIVEDEPGIYTFIQDQIIRRGIHIEMNITPDDIILHTDRNALGIIVSNLISNATKYCDEGGEIRLSARRQDGHTLIVFSNTGRGIPTEECGKVFDKFYRSIATGHQQVKGFGLGLAVVRRFAGLLGATVRFDSCPEGPTTVSVVL
jgi:signal transduction histidine kinase